MAASSCSYLELCVCVPVPNFCKHVSNFTYSRLILRVLALYTNGNLPVWREETGRTVVSGGVATVEIGRTAEAEDPCEGLTVF